jgi:hypothetical protein
LKDKFLEEKNLKKCDICGRNLPFNDILRYESTNGKKMSICKVCYNKMLEKEFQIFKKRLAEGQSYKSACSGLKLLEENEKKFKEFLEKKIGFKKIIKDDLTVDLDKLISKSLEEEMRKKLEEYKKLEEPETKMICADCKKELKSESYFIDETTG